MKLQTRVKMLEAVKRRGADTSLHKLIMLTITQGEMNEYVTAVRELDRKSTL